MPTDRDRCPCCGQPAPENMRRCSVCHEWKDMLHFVTAHRRVYECRACRSRRLRKVAQARHRRRAA